MWTFSDLTTDELDEFARQTCDCDRLDGLPRGVSYTCITHRARAELTRRWQRDQHWPTSTTDELGSPPVLDPGDET